MFLICYVTLDITITKQTKAPILKELIFYGERHAKNISKIQNTLMVANARTDILLTFSSPVCSPFMDSLE
jgi:hypothetical protein